MCALNYFEGLLLEVRSEVRAFVHSNEAFLYFSVLLYTYVHTYVAIRTYFVLSLMI